MNKNLLPHEVKYIISTLEAGGHRAYAVGGCVRDTVMGKTPKDWDVCTSALPEQTMHCFKNQRVVPTGLHHGTVSLLLSGKPYEITTFRTDGTYSDNRRPDNVNFVSELKVDLSRRDFTINALAYHPDEGVVDYFGGMEDISLKLIRCVGDCDIRFGEDALRIMRAIRFCSTLGYEIENSTLEAMMRNRGSLKNIAAERIAVELDSLLAGENVKKVLEDYSGVIEVIIPEITPMIGFEQNNSYHDLDAWRHTVKAVASAPRSRILRLTMLLHDIAKPECYTETKGVGHFYGHPKQSSEKARSILNRLKYDRETVKTVTQLVLYHDADIIPSEKHVKRWLGKLGIEGMRMLCAVKKADAMAKSTKRRAPQLEEIEAITNLIDKIIAKQDCFTIKDLAVNGKDLIDIGIPEGKQIGSKLRELLSMVIDGKLPNDRAVLLKEALLTCHIHPYVVSYTSNEEQTAHYLRE